jgi:hypothetical protein
MCLKPVSLLRQINSQSKRFLRMAEKFSASEGEIAAVPVDPTRGSLLGMLARTPDLRERIAQGGVVGYITIAVGIVGLGHTVSHAVSCCCAPVYCAR